MFSLSIIHLSCCCCFFESNEVESLKVHVRRLEDKVGGLLHFRILWIFAFWCLWPVASPWKGTEFRGNRQAGLETTSTLGQSGCLITICTLVCGWRIQYSVFILHFYTVSLKKFLLIVLVLLYCFKITFIYCYLLHSQETLSKFWCILEDNDNRAFSILFWSNHGFSFDES